MLFVGWIASEDVFECSPGWLSNGRDKCIFLVDIEATYDEAKAYCDKSFGAKLLNISTEEDRLFWSVYLVKLANISNSAWLDTPDKLKQEDSCLILQSKYDKGSGRVGMRNCNELGATVCEMKEFEPNKKVIVQESDPNDKMIKNERIILNDGTS